MKAQKFYDPATGRIVESTVASEIKMMRACAWRKVKEPKIYYAKGLSDGNSFLK